MKTKLLKKVRRRYSIVRVDKVTRSSPEAFNICKKSWGLPFYYAKDEECSFIMHEYARTRKGALEGLAKMIRKEYKDLFLKREYTKKVWWKK